MKRSPVPLEFRTPNKFEIPYGPDNRDPPAQCERNVHIGEEGAVDIETWWIDGELSREDYAAIICIGPNCNDYEAWYRDVELNRNDGYDAIVYLDGKHLGEMDIEEWYRVTKSPNEKVNRMGESIATVSNGNGVKYRNDQISCSRCRVIKPTREFLGVRGKIIKKCRECAMIDKCSHGKQKRCCKECGGSAICSHGKHKRYCKECGGSSICPHGKQKSYCKQCGGSAICSHGKRKYDCKQCGGSAICSHGIHEYGCKKCGGSGICLHGKQKTFCKECDGVGICLHGKHKYDCKECRGLDFCSHRKRRSKCNECKAEKMKRDQHSILGIQFPK